MTGPDDSSTASIGPKPSRLELSQAFAIIPLILVYSPAATVVLKGLVNWIIHAMFSLDMKCRGYVAAAELAE